MKFKLIFFDVANTLLYKPTLFGQIRKALSLFDIDAQEEFLRQRHKMVSELITFPPKTSREFYDHFNSEFLYCLGITPNKKLTDAIYNYCKYQNWDKYKDSDILSKINCQIGIISNWDSTLLEKVRDLLQCQFSQVIVSSKAGYSKPDKKIFLYGLKQAKAKPEEVLYIGDSIKLDIVPANQVGITSILLDRHNDYPFFSGPKIKSLHDLHKYLI